MSLYLGNNKDMDISYYGWLTESHMCSIEFSDLVTLRES